MPIAAATHTSNVFWFLPLLGLLLIGVVMFRWSRRAQDHDDSAAGASGA